MKLRAEFSSTLLLWLSFISSAFFFSATFPAHADPLNEGHSLQRQIDQLTQAQKALETELKEIKQLLQGVAAPNNMPRENLMVGVEANPFRGDANAKVTLVEFSDYECPFCGSFFKQTFPTIEQEFIATGKIKYIRRDFPLESIHRMAFKAAEAANCAGTQGKYWEMHDQLFQNQSQLETEDLPKHGKAIGLDIDLFQECLKGGSQRAEIRKDMEDGLKAGVQGTPTFFIGIQDSSGQNLKVLRTVIGAQPYAEFKNALDWALREIEN